MMGYTDKVFKPQRNLWLCKLFNQQKQNKGECGGYCPFMEKTKKKYDFE